MRLKLGDHDRDQYGGPEWLLWARTVEWLNDLDGDALIALDDELGELLPDIEGPLVWLHAQVAQRRATLRAMRVVKGLTWLMLRAENIDIPLSQFTPRLLAITSDRGDADPPPGGEESSPTSTPTGPTASPASETSTSPSTPGSRNATQE